MAVPSASADVSELYYYNGLVLPDLPEWNDSLYSYGFIVGHLRSDGTLHYQFIVCENPLEYCYDFLGKRNVISLYGNGCSFNFNNGMWEIWDEDELLSHYYPPDSTAFLWSSHNIANKVSGGTYFYGSVPVAVSGSGDSGDSGDSESPGGTLPEDASILDVLTSIYEMDTGIVSVLGQLMIRLRYIESDVASILELLSTFTPTAQESALKQTTAESVTEFTETFWSDEGGGFGRSNITESGFVLKEAQKMFDSGVSVTEFFGMFGTHGWGNWFSVETRNDLDTVSRPALMDADDGELSTYEKNLQEIQQFVGGD